MLRFKKDMGLFIKNRNVVAILIVYFLFFLQVNNLLAQDSMPLRIMRYHPVFEGRDSNTGEITGFLPFVITKIIYRHTSGDIMPAWNSTPINTRYSNDNISKTTTNDMVIDRIRVNKGIFNKKQIHYLHITCHREFDRQCAFFYV